MYSWRHYTDVEYDVAITRSWSQSHQLPKLRVISYTALISASSKGRRWQRVVALLEEMSRQGLQADVITDNATMSVCEEAGWGSAP